MQPCCGAGVLHCRTPISPEQMRAGLRLIEERIGVRQRVAERVILRLMQKTGCSFDDAVEAILAICLPVRHSGSLGDAPTDRDPG